MLREFLPSRIDILFFRENGYWIAPKLFDEGVLSEACEHMEMIYRGEHDKGEAPFKHYRDWHENPGCLRKTDNSWWADSVMTQFATSPLLGHIAALLLGVEEIYLWHDQMLYKPAHSAEANIGWHQDKAYWATSSTTDMITAWVAFEDVNEANGCMRVVPGSHRWGLLNENDGFNQDLEGQRSRMHLPEGAVWKEVPLTMKAGQVSFHHCMTVHGSGPNVTSKPRRSIAVHLMSGEARLVKGKGHYNEMVFGGEDGQLFRGPRFPRLWPT
ncbi:MAG TPA: phytanoyl-CoA dioxygenase family protein [Chthonomonadales bacterium]|nr:phytanoyl-CoA dioxygenase family protein [Chthonomonadales bacterium]